MLELGEGGLINRPFKAMTSFTNSVTVAKKIMK
jgi:hypothetical protein